MESKGIGVKNEGYYAVASFLAIIITLVVHYFFLSGYEMHSSIHVSIGLVIFLVLSGFFSFILSKLW
ncbi:hypothetical protein COU54_03865 [Candidatus Pacearchaeota archaeon CG10_big_fil_rev_8_21_14_0_10_31_24]|nr:MAG: hypothetical protein COU54_03865 [Candidatus Pacearchaeota archaeon CG10_big_fil_rev_8_21_14_0_10_31_24]